MTTQAVLGKPCEKCWFPGTDCPYDCPVKCITCRRGFVPKSPVKKKVVPKSKSISLKRAPTKTDSFPKYQGIFLKRTQRKTDTDESIAPIHSMDKNSSNNNESQEKQNTDEPHVITDTTFKRRRMEELYSPSNKITTYRIVRTPNPASSSKAVTNEIKSLANAASSSKTVTNRLKKFRHAASSSKTVKNGLKRFRKLTSSSKRVTKGLNGCRNSASSSETATNEMKNVTDILKRLQRDMEELKKSNSNGSGTSTASAENNPNGLYCSRILSSMRISLEEENSLLKNEINQLNEKICETRQEIIKKAEDKKKQKASLLAKLEILQDSIENVNKETQENHENFIFQRNKINREAIEDVAMGQVNRYRCMVATLKRELEKYDPTPPEPKPDPYKTPQHLDFHEELKVEIVLQRRGALHFRDKLAKCKIALDKLDTCLSDQKKKNYILTAVLDELIKLYKHVQFSLPNNDNPDVKKMEEEVAELEISVTKKAEKEYEEMEAKEKAKRSESINLQEGCSKSIDPQEGCSKSSDTQEDCLKSSGAQDKGSEIIDLGEGCSYR